MDTRLVETVEFLEIFQFCFILPVASFDCFDHFQKRNPLFSLPLMPSAPIIRCYVPIARHRGLAGAPSHYWMYLRKPMTDLFQPWTFIEVWNIYKLLTLNRWLSTFISYFLFSMYLILYEFCSILTFNMLGIGLL